MGYSCTRDAQDTLAVVSKLLATDGNPNIWTIGKSRYFFERGDENADGSITGDLMLMLSNDLCQRAGRIRIDKVGCATQTRNG